MRTVKEYDERRNEILDRSAQLFAEKGYEQCTVNDILKAVAIAKGTFYYYFKSKEEVMDAIVSRMTDGIILRAQAIPDRIDLGPQEKLVQAFLSMRADGHGEGEILTELHKPENVLMHQKTLNQLVTRLSPVLAEIISDGMEKNVWQCAYPLEYMQIFLVAAVTLTDEGIFALSGQERTKIMAALASVLEKMLQLPEGSCKQAFMQNWG